MYARHTTGDKMTKYCAFMVNTCTEKCQAYNQFDGTCRRLVALERIADNLSILDVRVEGNECGNCKS